MIPSSFFSQTLFPFRVKCLIPPKASSNKTAYIPGVLQDSNKVPCSTIFVSSLCRSFLKLALHHGIHCPSLEGPEEYQWIWCCAIPLLKSFNRTPPIYRIKCKLILTFRLGDLSFTGWPHLLSEGSTSFFWPYIPLNILPVGRTLVSA